MSGNKNQHIIPQHYLRGFSIDRGRTIKNAEKRICRSNIKEPVKPYAAIKKTCTCSHFYVTKDGIDKVDEINKMFEAVHAPILDELISDQELPLDSDKIKVLLTFIMLLSTRTESARELAVEIKGKEYTEKAQQFQEELGYHNHKVKITFDPVKAQYNMMRSFILNSFRISDLNQVLLINESKRRFMTSDNPVVFYNYKMFENMCITDLSCSGLMIFCPLTENLLLLYFDKDLYDMHIDTPTTIKVKKESDIDSINKLQLLQCYDEIYCYDDSELDNIEELYASVKNHVSNHIGTISYKIRPSFIKINKENNRKYNLIMREHERDNKLYPVTRDELSSYIK